MSDGDGTQRAVAALRTALVGRAVIRFDGPHVNGPPPLPGRVIEQVHRRGRHVQVVWDDGLVLHTHLRFSGVWHLYRDDERWRRPSTQLRVAITVPKWVAVCFNAPLVETYREFDRYRHPGFGRSGPDLCAARPDHVAAVVKMLDYAEPSAPVADVLVDPHVVCGIGNVYRSEVLWSCGVHPLACIGDLAASTCRELIDTAALLLRRNVEIAQSLAPADTRDTLDVYGRNGQRCARCGDTVAVRRSGDSEKLLYWCPGCQITGDPHDRFVDAEPAPGWQSVSDRFDAVEDWPRRDLAG